MIELLGTKLFIPRPRKNLVSRPHLIDRLNVGLDKKLTLIAAPAGFGKTTLLSEWIPQSPRCVTWLSLDEGDDDPTKFWAYFISSLQRLHPDIGKGALTLLQSPQPPPVPSILTALINDLIAFPEPFAIVLNDYHFIDSPPIHEALTFLIDHLPANMHLVLTTRIDPPLPLSRLRAGDKLMEIRANNLRFTTEETGTFLNVGMGLNLSVEEISILEARTEGWIAGLQIAALSMQGREDTSRFIRDFSGSHRHILGYLAEEVLDQQPKGTFNFLLKTSILEQLCGSLCDAVTGGSNGQAILESLMQDNLFITPLDDQGNWYRYHHLFAEVLQAKLEQEHHELVTELHARAGKWYANQDKIEGAIRHALAGSDFEGAARLIESVAGKMLRQGSSTSLIHWLDALPGEILRTRPRLCLARGWTFVWGPTFHLERAKDWAQGALQIMSTTGLLDNELTGEVFALKALIAADQVDLSSSREFSHRALACLSNESPWRVVAEFSLGSTLYAAGEFSAASPALTEALRLGRSAGALYIQLLAANFLADILAFQGRLESAVEMYRQVLTWSDPDIPQKGALVAHAGLANVLCEQGHLDAAYAHVQSGIEQLEQVGGPGAALWLYRTLARVKLAQGNEADALNALEQAYKSGQTAQIPFVMTQAGALQAKLQLLQGNLDAAITWMANSGLNPEDPDASHPGLREIEYLTLARVLAAQNRHAEALSLLDRLLRSAQSDGRNGSTIEILILQALCEQTRGNPARAREHLAHALGMAEPRGYIRIFVDEGEPMRLLLCDYQSILNKKLSEGVNSEFLRQLSYSDKLLAAFAPRFFGENPKQTVIPEPLSERELEVLRLIAIGHTNQEISEILMVALSTVKSHINNLYGKLSANRRTEAIAIARDLGLISG